MSMIIRPPYRHATRGNTAEAMRPDPQRRADARFRVGDAAAVTPPATLTGYSAAPALSDRQVFAMITVENRRFDITGVIP